MTRACCSTVWIAGLALLYASAPLRGQWTGVNPVWTNSPVGIGTASPASKLTISGSGVTGAGQSDLMVIGTGTVGAGINLFSSDTGGRNWAMISTGSLTGIPGSLGFYDATAYAYRLVVNPNGNVGIGSAIPQYKLSVEGAIGARDIIVTNTPWSDHVFRPGYQLRPLSEVASFIRQHGRLPEIPSEAEVKAKGVSVAEVQAKLLATSPTSEASCLIVPGGCA